MSVLSFQCQCNFLVKSWLAGMILFLFFYSNRALIDFTVKNLKFET